MDRLINEPVGLRGLSVNAMSSLQARAVVEMLLLLAIWTYSDMDRCVKMSPHLRDEV